MLGGDFRETKDMFISLELIHNATLVHDDIIDEDLFRRGGPSLFSKHGVKKAVLAGDALFSFGLIYASKTGNPEIVKWLAETALKMVQGITLQYQSKHQMISIEEYFHMNYLKSGSLFEAAGALGAIAGSNNIEDVIRLALFGKYFGNAYQIRDDIIDAFIPQKGENTPTNDLLNGDISLLLIYALNSQYIDDEEKEALISLYEGNTSDLDIEFIRMVYRKTGALQSSIDKMEEFAKKAENILDGYPKCQAKDDLLKLLSQYNQSGVSDVYQFT
jgi:octaprenyl-diphosphate synthase